MWKSQVDLLDRGKIRKVSILGEGKPMLYAEVVNQWQHNKSFRTFFMSVLTDAPFAAYFWETPPVRRATVNQPFEFVQVDSPLLATVTPDPHAFASHFKSADPTDGIVSFANLGKDAVLVAPCPDTPLSAYPHLAAFTRKAPISQQHALWRRVGAALKQHLQEQPIWLSTAGLGVSWLHVRLDSRPKYYSFRPYREAI